MKKKYTVLCLIALLSVILSACELVKPVSEIDPNIPQAPSGNTSSLEPVSDPSDKRWDWGYTDTSYGERWYQGGDTSRESFSVQPDDEGMMVISFFNEDGTVSSDSSFSITNMHLINEPGAGKEFDLIFLDTFTAYDAVTDRYYLRGDYKSLFTALISHAFRSSLYEDEYIVFRSDGSAQDVYEGEYFSGSWYIENAHRLLFHDDATDSDHRFYYSFSEDGQLLGLLTSAGELWEAFEQE